MVAHSTEEDPLASRGTQGSMSPASYTPPCIGRRLGDRSLGGEGEAQAGFLEEAAAQPAGQGGEALAPGGDALPRPSPYLAHSRSACATHQLRPRGARIFREEKLCAAQESPPAAAVSARPPAGSAGAV